ncbi:hypothetical protein, partial [Aquisphaera insulae]|uniref:hypothetical protein n=1 Tax=Aquisphaera insulae TaxID=2712864 RepID=UPI00196A40F4
RSKSSHKVIRLLPVDLGDLGGITSLDLLPTPTVTSPDFADFGGNNLREISPAMNENRETWRTLLIERLRVGTRVRAGVLGRSAE